jgi:hypothetical protein
MNYYYQVIFIGNNDGIIDNIINLIYKKIQELDMPPEIIKIIDSNSFSNDYQGNQPAFVFYIGDKNGEHKDVEVAEKLIKDSSMILPIYFGNYDDAFYKEIPEILYNQNGIRYSEGDLDRLVDTALESLELLRSTRKVFISYRRSESTSVAIQLYEALEAYNFDVFLDTHTISKAKPFQDELWHRMTDCDVIVLLNTPEFLESKWCKEEFAEAATKQIGIVQLVWPNQDIRKIDSSSHISYPHILKQEDFINNIFSEKDNSKLMENTVKEIVFKVESIRARNLAARQDNLITEFRNIADKNGKIVTVQPEKFLTQDLPNGERRIYIPTIGIPQSINCQSAEIRKELLKYKVPSIRLIYDDLRIRDEWLKHLDWLNDNFKKDIKTLKKTEFEEWWEKN